MSHNSQLTAVIASVRPALNSAPTTEEERAQFVYDLVREVYDHVKFDLHAPTEDTDERAQLGNVLDAALPASTLEELRMMRVRPEDHESLAAAVELTLELLDAAERRRSFPGRDGELGDFDDENERWKRESIKRERRRYKELRARLVVDEAHGVPVSREFLETALGLFPDVTPDDQTEELYEQWVEDQRNK